MDKTLPFYGLIMTRDSLLDYPIYNLPEGYSYSFYRPGDEKVWADIEVSVGEFDNRQDALNYFAREFAPYPEELKRRCVFVRDESGEYVATTSGWYGNLLSKEDMARIHWVAVAPNHQRKGLAKALMTKAFEIFNAAHDRGGAYLTTQTWSYKAINMYLEYGFRPYLGTKPESWKGTDKDFKIESKKGWDVVFSKLDGS